MKKVLIVSGDGNLIEKLRFIFFESYGASDITSISNPDNCISLASKIVPQVIVVDTSAFTGSMQSFFAAKNSQTITRKIPIVFFDKSSNVNDMPQLNAVIDASLNEQDISRSLSFIDDIQSSYDRFNVYENVNAEIDPQDFNDYLLDNQAYMLNEVKQDVESGRYQYQIVESSPKFDKVIGINPAIVQGISSLEYLHGIKNDQKSLFDNVPQDKRIIRTQQFYDTNQRYLDVVSFGISENKIATFVKDITPIKKLEKQEQDNVYEKMKNAFISNISHEVRTPMNAIIGFSRLLESDTIESAKRKQYVSIIQKSGFHLIETLDKIIDLSKIQTNQIVLNKKTVDLQLLFTELDVFVQRKLYENGKDELITFTVKKEKDFHIQSIQSDLSRLIQILKELIDNAVKFTNEGSIELGYEIQNGSIIFFVKDTGMGIDEKCLFDVFKMFKQIDNTEFSKSGLGLGISISQKIVEMMGGKMWAKSTLGVGSTFYFSIPTA